VEDHSGFPNNACKYLFLSYTNNFHYRECLETPDCQPIKSVEYNQRKTTIVSDWKPYLQQCTKIIKTPTLQTYVSYILSKLKRTRNQMTSDPYVKFVSASTSCTHAWTPEKNRLIIIILQCNTEHKNLFLHIPDLKITQIKIPRNFVDVFGTLITWRHMKTSSLKRKDQTSFGFVYASALLGKPEWSSTRDRNCCVYSLVSLRSTREKT
jgi:hypothetical protein